VTLSLSGSAEFNGKVIEELRVKAKHFEETGIIPTLDACASVAKSDTLVSSELHESLRSAFKRLKDDQAANPDWHPNTNEMVQDLVHPSMYPLVYGRSRVLKDEVVGVEDAVEKWAGKGDVIDKDTWEHDPQRNRLNYGVGSGAVPPNFWSATYQWLPSNVAFQEDGTVRFTSYINNLHPVKYAEVYRTIEKLITVALPAWDQCLAVATRYDSTEGAGRTETRIGYPNEPDDENPENWIPSDPQVFADKEIDWDKEDDDYDPEWDDETTKKWELLRKPRIPEVPFQKISYTPSEHMKLLNKFKESGLQIIVKLASIELTPEKPDFPAGGWHVEGQMNEHIAGTALYYLDSENVTSSNLSFRMQTDAYLNEVIEVGQDMYHWLEHIYGTDLSTDGPCLQSYGSVETRQGRLLAFPNVFHHRVSPFSLIDKTKPGHRRFIALWLVDPHQRVISTANVPPQQQDWWLESTFGSTTQSRQAAISKVPPELVNLVQEQLADVDTTIALQGKLPPELMEMVRGHFNAGKHTLPMSVEEAREHRLKLMEERGAFVQETKDSWYSHSYSFCEH